MVNFLPLAALKAATKACRNDLATARALNAELGQKIAAASAKQQFTSAFITQQVSQLRQEFSQKVTNYLVTEKTLTRLGNIKAQERLWTVRHFLMREQIAADPFLEMNEATQNQVALLKTLITISRLTVLVLSVARGSTSGLSEEADAAIANSDWAKLSMIFTELEGRSTDEARRVLYELDRVDIPDVVAAKELIAEAKQIEELLHYCLASIGSGDEDVGLRISSYIEQNDDKVAATSKAVLENELAREAAAVLWQLGHSVKPVA